MIAQVSQLRSRMRSHVAAFADMVCKLRLRLALPSWLRARNAHKANRRREETKTARLSAFIRTNRQRGLQGAYRRQGACIVNRFTGTQLLFIVVGASSSTYESTPIPLDLPSRDRRWLSGRCRVS